MQAPAGKKKKKQGERPVLRSAREAPRQERKTATPRRQAGHGQEAGWIGPSPVWTNLSKKPESPAGPQCSVTTPVKVWAKATNAPLAHM